MGVFSGRIRAGNQISKGVGAGHPCPASGAWCANNSRLGSRYEAGPPPPGLTRTRAARRKTRSTRSRCSSRIRTCSAERPAAWVDARGEHPADGRRIWAEVVDDQCSALAPGRAVGAACLCLFASVSYTHLRAHETGRNLVCRLLLEKKK